MLHHAVGMVASILIARLLGPQLRGVVVAAIATATVVASVCQLGLPQALNYNLARTQDRTIALNQALAVCVRLTPVILLCVAAAYLALGAIARDSVLRGLSLGLTIASLGYCLATIAQEIQLRLLVGLEDYTWRNVLILIPPILVLVLAIGYSALDRPMSPLSVTIGYGMFTLASVLVGSVYLWWRYRPTLGTAPPKDWTHTYLGYGLKFCPSLIVNMLNYRADTFIVNALLGSAALGLYATGVGMAEVLLFLPHAVNFVFFTRISSASAAERHALTVKTLGASLYLVTLGGILLGILIPYALPVLYGSAFRSSVGVSLCLLPGMLALTIVKILTNAVAGCGRPEFASYTTSIGLVATIALDLILIPRFGILGAAWASVLSYVLWAIVVSLFYVRLMKAPGLRFTIDVLLAPLAWLLHSGRTTAARIGWGTTVL
jgi:O-antigen/teichoic acid export membrane protein